jgi:hypothetical protein
MAITPVPRNVSGFVMPLIASFVAPLGVAAALALGAASYAGVAVTAWLLRRAPEPRSDRLS